MKSNFRSCNNVCRVAFTLIDLTKIATVKIVKSYGFRN